MTAMFNPLPAIALLPLAMIWFGLGTGSLVFVLILSVLWAVALNTHAGFRGVSNTHRMVGQNYGLGGLRFAAKILIPAAFPSILAGLKIGWAFAWRSLMAAEIYVTILTGFGLGHLLHYGRELHAMDQVVGLMLLIIFIGFAADKLLFSPWERFLRRRWGLSPS